MELINYDNDGNKMTITYDNEFVDFCVISKEDQYDFNININEWILMKEFIDKKIEMEKE